MLFTAHLVTYLPLDVSSACQIMPVRAITMFMPQGTQPVGREAILAQSIAVAQ